MELVRVPLVAPGQRYRIPAAGPEAGRGAGQGEEEEEQDDDEGARLLRRRREAEEEEEKKERRKMKEEIPTKNR